MSGSRVTAAIGLVLVVTGFMFALKDACGAEEVAAPRDIPVEDLQPGRQRDEWEVVPKRHPHGREPGWVLKVGWSVPRGCTTLGGGLGDCFMRVCPTNGALTLDWAQVEVSGDRVTHFESGKGQLPRSLTRPPDMAPEAAWTRVVQALQSAGAEIPEEYGQPPATLRLAEDRMGRHRRIRLVYQFAPEGTSRRVSVDTQTGEVGGIALAYLGAQFLDPKDPLRKLGGWKPTVPRLASGRTVEVSRSQD
jgi:hypothetical protein